MRRATVTGVLIALCIVLSFSTSALANSAWLCPVLTSLDECEDSLIVAHVDAVSNRKVIIRIYDSSGNTVYDTYATLSDSEETLCYSFFYFIDAMSVNVANSLRIDMDGDAELDHWAGLMLLCTNPLTTGLDISTISAEELTVWAGGFRAVGGYAYNLRPFVYTRGAHPLGIQSTRAHGEIMDADTECYMILISLGSDTLDTTSGILIEPSSGTAILGYPLATYYEIGSNDPSDAPLATFSDPSVLLFVNLEPLLPTVIFPSATYPKSAYVDAEYTPGSGGAATFFGITLVRYTGAAGLSFAWSERIFSCASSE